jgi:hypothetical protein
MFGSLAPGAAIRSVVYLAAQEKARLTLAQPPAIVAPEAGLDNPALPAFLAAAMLAVMLGPTKVTKP